MNWFVLGWDIKERWFDLGLTMPRGSFLRYFFLLVILAAVYIYLDPRSQAPPSIIYVFLLAFSLLVVFSEKLQVWLWKRNFSARPEANVLIEWEFANDYIYNRTETGEAKNQWKGLLKIVEVRDGFLFYPVKNVFYWIPFSAFERPECIDKVREFIVKNKCQFIQQK